MVIDISLRSPASNRKEAKTQYTNETAPLDSGAVSFAAIS